MISANAELDGRPIPLSEALTAVLVSDGGSVVCCLAGRLAWYKPEPPEPSYVLEKR